MHARLGRAATASPASPGPAGLGAGGSNGNGNGHSGNGNGHDSPAPSKTGGFFFGRSSQSKKSEGNSFHDRVQHIMLKGVRKASRVLAARHWKGTLKVTWSFGPVSLMIGANIGTVELKPEPVEASGASAQNDEWDSLSSASESESDLHGESSPLPEDKGSENAPVEEKESRLGRRFLKSMKKIVATAEKAALAMEAEGMGGIVGASLDFTLYSVGIRIDIEAEVTSIIVSMHEKIH